MEGYEKAEGEKLRGGRYEIRDRSEGGRGSTARKFTFTFLSSRGKKKGMEEANNRGGGTPVMEVPGIKTFHAGGARPFWQ